MNDCYYSNCDLYKNNEHCMDSIEFCEYSLREHDKQIRAEVIDEFVKAIEKHQTRQDSYLDPPYVEMGLDMTDVLEVAEQLKEQKNE